VASLYSPPVYSRKRVTRCPTLPFTTVQDDPYVAPVFKLSAQLFVPI